jgi:hypothetical protein
MRRMVVLLSLTLFALVACRATEEVLHRGEVLTFDQYQSIKIEDRLTAKTVLDRYGKPKVVHETDGRIRRMIYRCEDRTGAFRDLELIFDGDEILQEKHL